MTKLYICNHAVECKLLGTVCGYGPIGFLANKPHRHKEGEEVSSKDRSYICFNGKAFCVEYTLKNGERDVSGVSETENE